jgi:hypothetical protein
MAARQAAPRTAEGMESRTDPAVRAALAELIGAQAADAMTATQRACTLARMNYGAYKQALTRTLAAMRAEEAALAAPPPPSAEEVAARVKLDADLKLATTNFPLYKEQRDREARERIAARKSGQKGK